MELLKKGFVILIFLINAGSLCAQNFVLPNPHFFNNRYAFNPSLAGSLGYTYIAANYRKQSIGNLSGTPQQAYLGVDIPFQYRRNNVGLQLYSRKAGLFQNTFFATHYALQVMPTPNQRIRLGVGGGLKFARLDIDELDPSDPATQNWKNKTDPLLQLGLSYNIGNFWTGFALTDVLRSDPFEAGQPDKNNALKYYNAFVSYKFIPSEDLYIETALLHRSREYDMSSIELNAIGMLQNKYWLALSFRNDIGLTAMAGLKISGFLSTALGYKTTDFFSKKTGNSLNNPALDVLLGFHLGTPETAKEEWQEKEERKKKTAPEPKKAIDTAKKTTPKDTTPKPPAVRTIAKGNQPNDLNYDNYVVVGTFSQEANARNYADKITKEMKLDAKLGFNSVKNLYYIYIFKSSEFDPALKIYEQYRGTNQFGDIWILRIVKE